MKSVGQVLAVLLFLIPLFIAGVFAFWFYENHYLPSSSFTDGHIEGTNEVKPGSIIRIRFEVTRYRTCAIEIQRLIENLATREEIQLQRVLISFVGTGEPFQQEYRIEVPREIKPGSYKIYNRVRYYCNPLDYIAPRIITSGELPLTVL
jgi:hypothetical protein